MPPPATVIISPARRVQGRLNVPGDKSISHRYALLAALAEGRSDLTHFAPGADCRSTLACLRQLGVEVAEGSDGAITVIGRGIGCLHPSAAPLDAGNSGTTMRLMAGIAAGHPFSTQFVGDESLSRRPMRRVMRPLEQMGARIDATDGHAPLTVHGGHLRPISYRPDVPSAQVKSAVLLAGLHTEGVTTVHEPAATRDHTERAVVAFGGTVSVEGTSVSVAGGQRLTARQLSVPGDFSSAAFWLVAAAAIPGSRVEIDNVGLNPTRTGLLDVLRRFGARVDVEATTTDGGEPQGTITVEYDQVRAVEIAPDEVPGLIDELPAIAALAAHGGQVVVSGAAELRVKESDRISALVAGFRPSACRPRSVPTASSSLARRCHRRPVEALPTPAAITAWPWPLRLRRSEPTSLRRSRESDAVVISYPGFFDMLKRLTA